MCGSTQSLHIYSRVLQDPFQVSEEYSKNAMYFNDFIQQKSVKWNMLNHFKVFFIYKILFKTF